ncbi:MAG: Ppx/GppA phosphatase family protein [Candidatus Kapabacteria bacterium]|nr:Ppx/GppA phosphatase family protein [Candidatus Kapabacteria bacterium]
MSKKSRTIAAIDIGTNSIHMVIASVNQRKMLSFISRDKEMVRLGCSGKDMKHLESDAIERGVRTLKHFAEIAKSENAMVRAVATSAVREALNSHEFIEMVSQEAGIEAEIVSGIEEGRLIYLGAINAISCNGKKTLVIDIGGGSTETIIGTGNEIIYVDSHKLGAIRLSNRFFPNGIIDKKSVDDCREYIVGEWTPILDRLKSTGFEIVLGCSGTITNLALISLAMKGERIPENINGLVLTKEDLMKVIKKIISSKNLKQRLNIPGIDPTRADIITGGALIFEQIMRALDIKQIIISAYALREGILFDTIEKFEADLQHTHPSHLKLESLNHIIELYQVDIVHANHILKLAIKLYDSLLDLHKLPDLDIEYLEASALLHDVGYHISRDQHHKHSYYLIKNSVMPGYTNDELELIANVARYHRKSHPKKKHEEFSLLNENRQYLVMILAGILRIAEGLDRRQLRNVADLEIYPSWQKSSTGYLENRKPKTHISFHANPNDEMNAKRTLYVEIIPEPDTTYPDIELWGAERRKLLLEEVFDINIEFSIK